MISGNVSFYNETEESAIFPTPIIGMLGLIEDVTKMPNSYFRNEGDLIVLLDKNSEELGGSEYLKMMTSNTLGKCPNIYLEREKILQKLCLEAIKERLLISAHDCSEGGLAVALAECCFFEGIGADITLKDTFRADALLFGEAQSRIVVSLDSSKLTRLEELSNTLHFPIEVIGRVGGDLLKIRIGRDEVVSSSVREMEKSWREAIKCAVEY